MDIQQIKELALANGFSLKEQASGNIDLHSYVYEFAQAVKNEVLAQARSVFNQEAVTINDTEFLDAEITQISNSMSENHFLDYEESEELEMLVAKAMKLGELYERKKWQEAKTIPEWIETSERMPNEGEEVLVHHYGHVVQATKDKKYSGGFKQRNCYGWEAVSSYISHWMPKNIELPESYHFYYENDAKQALAEKEEKEEG